MSENKEETNNRRYRHYNRDHVANIFIKNGYTLEQDNSGNYYWSPPPKENIKKYDYPQ